MFRKFGQDIADEFFDRGRREFGGFLYGDSNIAQPTYPSRGGYAKGQEVEAPAAEEPTSSVLDEKMALVGPRRDEPERDDPGIDRE